MEKTGKVIAAHGNKVIVKVTSPSMECGTCFAKKDCHCEGVSRFCTPINMVNAKVGDDVVVKIGSSKEVLAKLFSLIFPFLMMAIAFAAADYFWKGMTPVIIAFGVFVVFFVVQKAYMVKTGDNLSCPIVSAVKEQQPEVPDSGSREAVR